MPSLVEETVRSDGASSRAAIYSTISYNACKHSIFARSNISSCEAKDGNVKFVIGESIETYCEDPWTVTLRIPRHQIQMNPFCNIWKQSRSLLSM